MDVTGLESDLPAIWRRWESRYVAAGVDVNIVGRLKSAITTWTDWYRRWAHEAADLEALASDAYQRGHLLTAGRAWSVASLLHHFGGHCFVSDMAQFDDAHRRTVDDFARAASLVRPPAVRLEIPFGEVSMPGYLRKPGGVDRPPVAILFNGFEGAKEENEAVRVQEYLDRGMATVTWDGPGRGETWRRLPMTGDYGPAASALIDALETRTDVDATRIGAVGPKRGAFLAAKAAAHDERVGALALIRPGYDWRRTEWPRPLDLAFHMHLFHATSPEELAERMTRRDLTLEGEAARIAASTLIISGAGDSASDRGSRRLYDELAGDKDWVTTPSTDTTGNDMSYKLRPMTADYLATELKA
ncbi:MAG: alpha/beta hydrolase family protein [Acidimicrobiales bacterium]